MGNDAMKFLGVELTPNLHSIVNDHRLRVRNKRFKFYLTLRARNSFSQSNFISSHSEPGPFASRADAEAWLAWAKMQ